MRSKRVELILDTLKAVRGAKDLSKETDRVADALGKTAREGDKAGRAVDKTGKEMSEAARAAAKLDREIDQLTGSLKELALVQALTGDTMSKQIKEQETKLRAVSKNRKLLGDAAEPAAGFVANLSAKMGPLLAKMPLSPPILAALGGVAVAAAPLLGAAISGAIIGGVGVGGVVGGFVLASKDERVKAAAKGLGDRLEQRLYRAGGAFVGPTLDGLEEVEKALDTIDLEGMLRDASKFVPVLTGGVTTLITELGDGIDALIENGAGPVQAISNGIASIGEHLNKGMQGLAGNSEAAAAGLKDLFGLVNNTIDSVFGLVNILTDLYELNKAIGGDTGLQIYLQLTGAATDRNAFSARRLAEGTNAATEAMKVEADNADLLAEVQKELTAWQKLLTQAQGEYKTSLDNLAPAQGRAAELANGLRTAQQNLYGSAIAGVEANEAYEASWDSLSDSVKKNKGSLDIHTAAGRANRDSLQALLAASNEMYFADIAQGKSTEWAREKHEKRTEAVRKEREALGLNKDETERLIKTYGRIPKDKTTDLIQRGLGKIANQLEEVYYAQRALAEGKPINEVRRNAFAAKGGKTLFRGFHDGGYTGPGPKYQKAGDVHADEFVIRKESRRKIEQRNPGLLNEMNATGQLPGYAGGGLVAPIETRTRVPMNVNLSRSFVMSMEAALSKVTPAFGNWPSSPSAQRGDSGVWKRVVQLINAGPNQGSFGNAYRPGDPKWHGSGRAVDWMGFNMDALASFLAAKRPLELIHRTNSRDYAYTRGQNRGSFSNGLMQAHRNHIHIAMLNGGVIPEPVLGVGKSGRTYSFAENGRPERVLSAGQTAGGGGTVTIAPVIHINGSNISAKQIAAEVSREIGRQADAYARSVA